MMDRYGVKANIYFPKNDVSIYSGVDDASISYEDTPDFEIQVLIPDIYGGKLESLDTISNMFENNDSLYIKCDTDSLPVNSIIIITNKDKLISSMYKVAYPKEVRYRGVDVLHYYAIVPANIRRDELMLDSINIGADYFDEAVDNGHIDNNTIGKNEYSITDNLNVDNVNTTFGKEDQHKLMGHRRVNKFNLVDTDD
jgi:hypothetical protein